MTIDVYVEAGTKRLFAGEIEWPGWCRAARSEDDAIEALFAYGPRYAKVMGAGRWATSHRSASRRFARPNA